MFPFEVQNDNGKRTGVDLSIETALILASEILRMHKLVWDDVRSLDAGVN